MKPDEIKEGSSYFLRPKQSIAKGIVRKVERIEGNKVYVEINGVVKDFTLKIFAELAREEVST